MAKDQDDHALTRVQDGQYPRWPGSKMAWVQDGQGPKWSGSEMARVRNGQGPRRGVQVGQSTSLPGSELAHWVRVGQCPSRGVQVGPVRVAGSEMGVNP